MRTPAFDQIFEKHFASVDFDREKGNLKTIGSLQDTYWNCRNELLEALKNEGINSRHSTYRTNTREQEEARYLSEIAEIEKKQQEAKENYEKTKKEHKIILPKDIKDLLFTGLQQYLAKVSDEVSKKLYEQGKETLWEQRKELPEEAKTWILKWEETSKRSDFESQNIIKAAKTQLSQLGRERKGILTVQQALNHDARERRDQREKIWERNEGESSFERFMRKCVEKVVLSPQLEKEARKNLMKNLDQISLLDQACALWDRRDDPEKLVGSFVGDRSLFSDEERGYLLNLLLYPEKSFQELRMEDQTFRTIMDHVYDVYDTGMHWHDFSRHYEKKLNGNLIPLKERKRVWEEIVEGLDDESWEIISQSYSLKEHYGRQTKFIERLNLWEERQKKTRQQQLKIQFSD